jgi:hypothetical protein
MIGKSLSISPPLGVACVAAAWTFSASPAIGQSIDGMWRGEISCAKLSFTKGPLKIPIDVAVSGTVAVFSKNVLNADGSAIVGTEEGEGTIAGNGQIRLTSTWSSADPNPRYTFTASYSGILAGKSGNLRGTQIWSFDGKTENRSCSIALKR